MKLLSLQEGEKSADMDIKMVVVRASRYRVFGSAERIPEDELAIADLRDGIKPDDFATKFSVLERHPVVAIMLVRKL